MYDMLIANLRKHINLTAEDIDTITSRLNLKKVKRKHYLVAPQEYCRYEHFVIKGCFRSYFVDDRGDEHITYFAVEDYWITDLQSFISGEPATLYVEALEDSEVLQLSKNHLEELFQLVPQLNNYFRILYQKSIVSMNTRVLNAISSTADEHYLQFLKRYPFLEQRVPQYMIASYLGVTPEFLSKIRSRVLSRRS